MRTDRGLLMTYKTSTGSLRSPNNILGECKAFVGERAQRPEEARPATFARCAGTHAH